jgi:DNA-binding GntR family transcriptional regulator
MENYRTKREIAVSLLRNSIVTGSLTPGTRLILEDLASEYNLSLTPIREALPVIEVEGLIIQVPHRGAIVAPMDREEILELYGVRRALEGLVTRHAVPNLTDEQLGKMEETIGRMESSIADWTDFLNEDMRFHRYLYEAAGSSRWINTISSLWNRSARYMLTSTAMVGATDAIHQDNRDLLAACRERNAERAAEIVEAHLSYAETRLLEEWIASGPDGAKAAANPT